MRPHRPDRRPARAYAAITLLAILSLVAFGLAARNLVVSLDQAHAVAAAERR